MSVFVFRLGDQGIAFEHLQRNLNDREGRSQVVNQHGCEPSFDPIQFLQPLVGFFQLTRMLV